MNAILGIIIIAIGSFGQSSSYVPINKVKNWSWESFWLSQGIFAWLVFPFLGALLAVPGGHSLGEILSGGGNAAFKAMGYGVLWGVGGLTFGLSMRYLGVALGQSISLGTCSAFGTLIPAMMAGTNLLEGKGLILLIAVCVAIAGIATIGYAGSLRAKNMTEEQRRAAIKDFALSKGLLVALLAGVMSACFAFGLNSGKPIDDLALKLGATKLFVSLPATLMVTMGGFLTNAFYCIYQNIKNKTTKDYFTLPGKVLLNNFLFCALAGILWYSQFFGFGIGKSFFAEGSLILAFSWSILMSLNVTFSNVWGIILKEWKGVNQKTMIVLIIGLVILIFSALGINLFNVR
jgi:L-rhamnose-H+ transport protein